MTLNRIWARKHPEELPLGRSRGICEDDIKAHPTEMDLEEGR
jgi:hypothetical protein